MSATLTQLVDDLLRPVAYPDPAPPSVELRATHASWVFLTGSEVWKVKRPVDFGFLDYSEPNRRRHCCEEEVHLGMRLAPDVYRGVVPIYLGPIGHSFNPPGQLVDYAVRMRRLPDDESAESLLASGRLTEAHLAALANQLADFYAAAPVCPGHGHPYQLLSCIDENRTQTRSQQLFDAEVLEDLYQWQRRTTQAQKSRLLQRLDEGRVRDGHGDLRLEHVYFPNAGEKALVIDPIEFNRGFRCQDVALDVSFLAMELEARDRGDLAACFLSRLAEATNDYGFYPLLDLYRSYRAWVRAKVACFVASDPMTASAKVERKTAEAQRLFRLAASYMNPPASVQHLIVVGGVIGSGKTTLAESLGRELSLPVVSSDQTRKHLAGLRPTERGGSEIYTKAFTERTYAALLDHAASVLTSGRGVILDATFRTVESRARARAIANAYHRPTLFIEMTSDDRTVRERLRERDAHPSVSDARVDLLEQIRSESEPALDLPTRERMELDGRLPPSELTRQVLERLRSAKHR